MNDYIFKKNLNDLFYKMSNKYEKIGLYISL